MKPHPPGERRIMQFVAELWKPATLLAILAAILLPSNPQKQPTAAVFSEAAFGISLAMFMAAAWALERRRSRPAGGCKNCGYDLTGNVSGVCPECGSHI